MKILDLVLKKQWFDMIKDGNKREEYREIKPYWTKRLTNTDGSFKNFTHIKFRCGYTNQFIVYRIESIAIGQGKVEWGGIENKEVYVIKFADKQLKEEFNAIFNDVISNQVTEYFVEGKIDTNLLIGLFVKRIRTLFSDEKMEFSSNNDLCNLLLFGEDEHTKELLKLVSY